MIYLHERDQFWPSWKMERLGQKERIYLSLTSSLSGEFSLVQRRALNTPTRPCQDNEEFSFTRCVMEFITRRVGCHLDWSGPLTFAQYPSCDSLDQLESYRDLLENIREFSWDRLTLETGCYGKCSYKEYTFHQVKFGRREGCIINVFLIS